MRPRLRPGVRWAATPSGVAWLTPGGVVPMPGPGLDRWADRLAPLLTGALDRDALLGLVPARGRAAAGALIDRLLALGVAEDAAAAAPPAAALLTGPAELLRAVARLGLPGVSPGTGRGAPILISLGHPGGTTGPAPLPDLSGRAGSPAAADFSGRTGAWTSADHSGRTEPTQVPDLGGGAVAEPVLIALGRDGHEPGAGGGAAVLHAVLLDGAGVIGPIPPRPGVTAADLTRGLSLQPSSADPDELLRLLVLTALHHARATGGPSRIAVLSGDTVSVHPWPQGAEATTGRPFHQRAVTVVDPVTGIVRRLGEDGHAQTPMHVSEAHLDGAWTVGAGRCLAESRANAVRAALEWHAARHPVAAGTLARPLSGRDGRPVDAIAGTGPATGRVRPPSGTGSGDTWRDAFLRGLLDLARTEAVHAAGHGRAVPLRPGDPAVTPAGPPAGPDDPAAAGTTVVDLTAATGIPSAGIVVDGRLTGAGSALTLRRAVAAARRDRAGDLGPVRVRRATGSGRRQITPAQAVAALRCGGADPVAVSLTADPAVRRVLPVVLRVVRGA